MTFKYWLIVLLALILPLKGTMAAGGVRCHVPVPVPVPLASASQAHGTSSHGEPHAHASLSHGEHHAHDLAAVHAAAHAPGAHDGADDGTVGQTASDASCQACAAICGASPLPPAIAVQVPVVEPARDWSVLAQPEPPRRAVAGLERPPRTL